jgi:hypothetical protein
MTVKRIVILLISGFIGISGIVNIFKELQNGVPSLVDGDEVQFYTKLIVMAIFSLAFVVIFIKTILRIREDMYFNKK